VRVARPAVGAARQPVVDEHHLPVVRVRIRVRVRVRVRSKVRVRIHLPVVVGARVVVEEAEQVEA